MAINVVNIETLRQTCLDIMGGLPSEKAVLTEMIRCELWASTVISRRVLCNRLISSIAPLVTINQDDLHEILEDMERIGDVVSGPRGMLAAAPLRVVKVGDERYRVFGSLPNRWLRGFFDTIVPCGTAREIACETGKTMDEFLGQVGGIQLPPEIWAGFERVPTIGPALLDQLDTRLENEASAPGSFDDDIGQSWMVYRPIPRSGKSPWKKPVREDNGRFWRGWSLRGWPVYLWTAGGCPSTVGYIRLGSEEAARTVYALSLQAGAPIAFRTDHMGAYIVLEGDVFLPSVEYRYLMTVGDRIDRDGSRWVFQIPLEIWPAVGEKLRERLGIVYESKER